MEEAYLAMAHTNPNVLCSEVPFQLLEASSFAGDEPTAFLIEMFTVGYTGWIMEKHGMIRFSKELIDMAVISLWVRACRLYSNKVMEIQDPDWDKPFFAYENL